MAIKYGRPIEVRSAPAHAHAPVAATSAPLDLTIRPRRNRKASWTRRLVAESVLTADDLIWPLFLVDRSEEHTSELQSLRHLVCRLLLEKKKKQATSYT